MVKKLPKFLIGGGLLFGATGMAVALSVPQELQSEVYQNRADSKNLVRGQRSVVAPFKSDFSGLLNFPERVEAAKVKAVSDLPVIYGSMIYNDEWETLQTDPVGYYSFQPSSTVSFSEIAIHPNLYVNGGGCYSNRMIHYHLWEMYADDNSDIGITFNDYYCVVNTDKWSFVNNPTSNSATDAYLSYDMTYDPVTKTIYALQWGYYESDYCNLAKVDGMTGESNDIARLPQMCILASNNFGQLFGVSSADGIAYYIDKTNGSYIPLGYTGVSPKYMQSATVDPETNVIYWAATLSDETGALYTLNTTTGKADKVGNMKGNAEMTGLFIEAETKGLNAPAELENFTLSSKDGQASVSYTIPSKGFDGSSLAGAVNTYVYLDGVQVFSKSGNPGESVSGNFNVSSGSHTVVAYASNAAGEGVKTYRVQTTGKDVPAAPGNVTLAIQGGKANLSWTAPTQGLNGGEFDASKLTYTVKRFPGENIVAMAYKETSFSETLPAGTATYYYEVTAFSDGEEGGTARSNAEFVGSAFTVPYSQDFEDENSLDGFTIVTNEEGRGWYRWVNEPLNFKAAASKFNMKTQADNWLILPSIQLEGGKDYHLGFNERVFSAEDPEKFEVTIGNAATVEAQTRTLLPVKTVANEDWIEYDVPFQVSESGIYNIAFHCVSPAYAYYLIIDDITVTEDSNFVDTPMGVTNFKATDVDESAVLSWTAPSKGVNGGAINPDLLSYEIYDSTGKLLEANYKGTTYTDSRYADSDKQTFIYYQVTPIHGEKRGESSLCDFIVLGPDYEVPFKESFTGQSLDNTPWSLSTLAGDYASQWSIVASASNPDCEPYDSDGGMSMYNGYNLPSGCQARLTSPKVDLLTPAHPVLKFYVYKPGVASRETLEVQISHNDQQYETVATVDLKEGSGWQPVEIIIPRKYCKEGSMISFAATSGYGQNICIDCLTISDDESLAVGIDLEAADIEIPSSMMPGEEKEFKVTVFNNGATTVKDYTVSLLCDGQVVNSTKGESIEPGETYIYIFKATAEEEDYMHTYGFQGMVKCEGDINESNDKTEVKEITIGLSGIELVDFGDIKVSARNNVITIHGAEGQKASVYSIDGKLVASSLCHEVTEFALYDGVFIVKVSGKSLKVVL